MTTLPADPVAEPSAGATAGLAQHLERDSRPWGRLERRLRSLAAGRKRKPG